MTKFFHNIHYISYLFFIPVFYYVIHGSVFRPDNFIEEVGLGIFFMGFSFAFGSMGDIKKISKNERKLFLKKIQAESVYCSFYRSYHDNCLCVFYFDKMDRG